MELGLWKTEKTHINFLVIIPIKLFWLIPPLFDSIAGPTCIWIMTEIREKSVMASTVGGWFEEGLCISQRVASVIRTRRVVGSVSAGTHLRSAFFLRNDFALFVRRASAVLEQT
jgi:hypothetical protein